MDEPHSIIIVGAGLAGTRAAATLREEDFDGTITLVGTEPTPPYDHVPLSKHHLLDEPGFHRLFLHDDDWYATNDIDLRLSTTATSIDPTKHTVSLDDGSVESWDRLLLATGAEPRHLGVPGADLDGIHYLRTLGDADALKAALGEVQRITIIGDGFIGCEIAASARTLGIDVTLIGRGPLPMLRALGHRVATFFRDVHVAHGVDLRPDSDVVELRGRERRVDTVVLADGSELATDLVVVGIGALPRVDLARSAGIRLESGGVATDEFLATDAPGVYAAGDIAAVYQPASGTRLRREHWATALHHGPTAARNMLGAHEPFRRVPFFFTDQYDIWMEFMGLPAADDELVIRGDIGGGEHAEFVAFWLRQGRLTAGMNVNVKEVPPIIRRLIESGRELERSALIDPTIPLEEL